MQRRKTYQTMTDIDELRKELQDARDELRRAEFEYSTCLLTSARCGREQDARNRAARRVAKLEKKLREATAKH